MSLSKSPWDTCVISANSPWAPIMGTRLLSQALHTGHSGLRDGCAVTCPWDTLRDFLGGPGARARAPKAGAQVRSLVKGTRFHRPQQKDLTCHN